MQTKKTIQLCKANVVHKFVKDKGAEMLIKLIEMCKERIGSYENIATRLDVAPTVISDWKAKRRKPTPLHICQMAEIAKLNVAETLFIVMQELDEENAKSWEIWRPYVYKLSIWQ